MISKIFNHKILKIIGILMVVVPLLCAGYKKINRMEFNIEQSQTEYSGLNNKTTENDKRIYKIESDISVMIAVTEVNQKEILNKLNKIETQLYELTKKAKW